MSDSTTVAASPVATADPSEDHLLIRQPKILFKEPLEQPDATPPTPTGPTLGSALSSSSDLSPSGANAVRATNADLTTTDEATSGFWQTVQSAVSSMWQNVTSALSSWLFGPWGGLSLLIGGAVGVALLLYFLLRSDGPSTPASTPLQAISVPQVKDNLIQLNNQLTSTANQMTAMGIDQTTVNTQKAQSQLSYGTSIALSAAPSASPVTAKSYAVVDQNSPSQYQSLATVNASNALTTLSAVKSAPSERSLTANAAVMHGAEVQDH